MQQTKNFILKGYSSDSNDKLNRTLYEYGNECDPHFGIISKRFIPPVNPHILKYNDCQKGK